MSLKCKECGENEQKGKFCSNCGAKLCEEVNQINDYSESKVKQHKKHHKRNKMILLVIAVIAVIAAVVIGGIIVNRVNYTNTPEQKAIKIADKYFSAMKEGESTSEYKSSEIEDFINVLDYKYLNTKYTDKIKITHKYDRAFHAEYKKKDFDTYEDFVKDIKERYDEVIEETAISIEVWKKEDFLLKYTFLYDVEIANKLGEKLYKKVYVEVTEEKDSGEYKVSNFYY